MMDLSMPSKDTDTGPGNGVGASVGDASGESIPQIVPQQGGIVQNAILPNPAVNGDAQLPVENDAPPEGTPASVSSSRGTRSADSSLLLTPSINAVINSVIAGGLASGSASAESMECGSASGEGAQQISEFNKVMAFIQTQSHHPVSEEPHPLGMPPNFQKPQYCITVMDRWVTRPNQAKLGRMALKSIDNDPRYGGRTFKIGDIVCEQMFPGVKGKVVDSAYCPDLQEQILLVQWANLPYENQICNHIWYTRSRLYLFNEKERELEDVMRPQGGLPAASSNAKRGPSSEKGLRLTQLSNGVRIEEFKKMFHHEVNGVVIDGILHPMRLEAVDAGEMIGYFLECSFEGVVCPGQTLDDLVAWRAEDLAKQTSIMQYLRHRAKKIDDDEKKAEEKSRRFETSKRLKLEKDKTQKFAAKLALNLDGGQRGCKSESGLSLTPLEPDSNVSDVVDNSSGCGGSSSPTFPPNVPVSDGCKLAPQLHTDSTDASKKDSVAEARLRFENVKLRAQQDVLRQQLLEQENKTKTWESAFNTLNSNIGDKLEKFGDGIGQLATATDKLASAEQTKAEASEKPQTTTGFVVVPQNAVLNVSEDADGQKIYTFGQCLGTNQDGVPIVQETQFGTPSIRKQLSFDGQVGREETVGSPSMAKHPASRDASIDEIGDAVTKIDKIHAQDQALIAKHGESEVIIVDDEDDDDGEGGDRDDEDDGDIDEKPDIKKKTVKPRFTQEQLRGRHNDSCRRNFDFHKDRVFRGSSFYDYLVTCCAHLGIKRADIPFKRRVGYWYFLNLSYKELFGRGGELVDLDTLPLPPPIPTAVPDVPMDELQAAESTPQHTTTGTGTHDVTPAQMEKNANRKRKLDPPIDSSSPAKSLRTDQKHKPHRRSNNLPPPSARCGGAAAAASFDSDEHNRSRGGNSFWSTSKKKAKNPRTGNQTTAKTVGSTPVDGEIRTKSQLDRYSYKQTIPEKLEEHVKAQVDKTKSKPNSKGDMPTIEAKIKLAAIRFMQAVIAKQLVAECQDDDTMIEGLIRAGKLLEEDPTANHKQQLQRIKPVYYVYAIIRAALICFPPDEETKDGLIRALLDHMRRNLIVKRHRSGQAQEGDGDDEEDDDGTSENGTDSDDEEVIDIDEQYETKKK